ncbi:BNR/Asp-box repeat-containing protein [Asanoa hainanensis]|uniref:BNR/Asp-box repeat-containing protein n=1 Tax=Asanoa hainanensis TaxID=560556 RepID=A0A239N1C7_9ACTN|nr:sialidase family protein [Asanoa hainanensis]SNT47988.1 BNR/Asp-box repeat-containing protein [Asanoa hainanensis]
MPEVHHHYDRTAVAERITQPSFDELVDRSRHRVNRTRKARLAGVAVLFLLTAAPLLTLPGGDASNTLVVPPSASLPAWDAFDIIVEFSDTRYGVAQYPAETCGQGWLSVTQDGGKTWSELRPHPSIPTPSKGPEANGACVRPTATLAAPGTLIMGATAGPAFISHDSGQSWREYQPQVRVADSVPDGIVPRWPCDERQCKEQGLGWYDPATGDWMVLKNQPPGTEYVSVSVAFDGSIWVDGSGPDGSGEFQIAASRDRGHSWTDRTPAEDIDWLGHAGLLTAYDADTAYLYPTERDGFSLYRTTDGGQTWQPMPAAQQFTDIVFVWPNRQGGLTLADRAHQQHLSTDGGKSFVPVSLPVWGATPITGGLQGWPIDVAAADPVDLYLSEDGLTWQPVEVPYYQRP